MVDTMYDRTPNSEDETYYNQLPSAHPRQGRGLGEDMPLMPGYTERLLAAAEGL